MVALFEPETLTTFDHRRARVGATLGLLLGIAYGLIASTINAIVLWGIPLQFDLGSLLVNTLVSGVSMMVAGYVTAQPHASLRGVIFGALLMALVQTALSIFNMDGTAIQRAGLIFVLFTLFLPLTVLFLVVTVLLRLGANEYMDAMSYTGPTRVQRLARLGGGVVVVLLVIAGFSQFQDDEKEALRQVHTAIQAGLENTGPLPGTLKPIDNFRARAVPGYSLEISTDLTSDRSLGGASAERYVQVTATFDNGLVMYCLFGQALGEPICREQSSR